MTQPTHFGGLCATCSTLCHLRAGTYNHPLHLEHNRLSGFDLHRAVEPGKARMPALHARRLQVGAVSYLNTRPLVHTLDQLAPQADIVLDLPSRLADRLAAGNLDVALIPSIEFFHDPAYRIVSDACIGCRGPVLSVNLHSRVPMEQIGRLALDEGSRTSAALVRILLRERYGLEPQLEPLPIGARPSACSADAVLLIGDRAIGGPDFPGADFIEHWDLGDEWCRWAELPFVFAMWVAREGVELNGLEQALAAARDSGVAHLDEIARREAGTLGLSHEACLSYLRDNLYFYLGPRERRGLALFYRHAVEIGLAPSGRELFAVGQAT
jgi:chorismate dehydratase